MSVRARKGSCKSCGFVKEENSVDERVIFFFRYLKHEETEILFWVNRNQQFVPKVF